MTRMRWLRRSAWPSSSHHKARRKHWHSRKCKPETRNCWRDTHIVDIRSISVCMSTITTGVRVIITVRTSSTIMLRSRWHWTTLASCISCDPSANGCLKENRKSVIEAPLLISSFFFPGVRLTFRRYSSSNFNIWLLNDHTTLDWPSTSSTILSGQHPFTVSVGQSLYRDDTDACLVVTAVTRTEADTPSCLV